MATITNTPFKAGESALMRKNNPIDDKKTDEWYLNYIEQYRNSEFYEQLRQNPYLRENNRGYEDSILESIFGGGKGAAQYYEDLVSARNEYMSEILGQMREQKRNEPAEEIARRKAAGLNDDLNGGEQIGSGEAVQNDQPLGEGPSMMGGTQEIERSISSLWNCFTTAYSLTSGLLKDAQVLKAGKIANEQGEITNFVDWLKAGGEAAKVGLHGNGYENDNIIGYGNIDQSPSYFFSKFFKNNKRRKKFESAYSLATSSIEQTRRAYQESGGLKSDIMTFEKTRGEFNVATEQEMLKEWSADMFKMSSNLKKIELATKASELQGLGKYYKGLNWYLKANVENASLGAAQKKLAMDTVFNNFMAEWSQKLEKMAEDGGFKGIFASVMLGMLSMQQMNLLPSANISIIGK